MKHWQAEVAPVGHFTVLRALPTRSVQAIGPFVFLDHFGPAQATPETLPAHPHAGIEVMTILLAGANEHRDSSGHRGVVEAGGAQWMRAGRGILHAERNLPELAPTIHGLQIWARLPVVEQDCAPEYKAIAAREVPVWEEQGVRLRLLAGTWAEKRGPIPLATPCLLLHAAIPAACSWSVGAMPSLPENFEIALYGIAGHARLDDVEIVRGDMVVPDSPAFTLDNPSGRDVAELLILGGIPADRPLVFGGPFVSDSQAGIQRAHERYHSGQMGTLDGVPR